MIRSHQDDHPFHPGTPSSLPYFEAVTWQDISSAARDFVCFQIDRDTERERERDTETERETERQRDRETQRERERD